MNTMSWLRQCAWKWLVASWVLLQTIAAIPIDNGVKGILVTFYSICADAISFSLPKGYPKVTCGLHSIRVDVDTERPFQGRVYVKGESYNKDCVKSFAGTPPVAAAPVPLPAYAPPPAPGYGETVGIELGFGQCNMRRQRTLFPRGVEYTFTLVVSFHPLFITKVDKAYRIRCFYMETEKTVAQQLEVSMLTTHLINEQFPMPQCRYHIKRGGPDGPYIRYAKVGEPVHHVWECDAPAAWLYGILVKNCYVDDGQGNRVELLDERGCANDRHILPDLAYDQSLISAWVESHVFKYADKPHLFFTCTIVLCFKQDGGCNGITPPNCLVPAPALPVPGPYPALPAKPLPPPPVAYPPPPAPVAVPVAPAPVPAHGPLPYPPYNRDAPPVKEDRRFNASVGAGLNSRSARGDSDESAESTTTQSTSSSPIDRRRIPDLAAKSSIRRQKRQANHSETTATVKNRDLIETDLSAQPVIVLPFEEDGASKEDDDELHESLRKRLSFKDSYAVIPNMHGSGLPSGVCVSSSGFGILVALFIALFILSTTLTVVLVRRHAWLMNAKL